MDQGRQGLLHVERVQASVWVVSRTGVSMGTDSVVRVLIGAGEAWVCSVEAVVGDVASVEVGIGAVRADSVKVEGGAVGGATPEVAVETVGAASPERKITVGRCIVAVCGVCIVVVWKCMFSSSFLS
jgi:hypothetical protein